MRARRDCDETKNASSRRSIEKKIEEVEEDEEVENWMLLHHGSMDTRVPQSPCTLKSSLPL